MWVENGRGYSNKTEARGEDDNGNKECALGYYQNGYYYYYADYETIDCSEEPLPDYYYTGEYNTDSTYYNSYYYSNYGGEEQVKER